MQCGRGVDAVRTPAASEQVIRSSQSFDSRTGLAGPRVTIMEDESKAIPDESKPRRTPTPGGMYRRAEMRAYAESAALAGPIAEFPVEMTRDAPVEPVPVATPVLGSVDGIVQAIATVTPAPRPLRARPPAARHKRSGRTTVSSRRRNAMLAAALIAAAGVLWFATPSTTRPDPVVQDRPVVSRASEPAIQPRENRSTVVTPPVSTPLPTVPQANVVRTSAPATESVPRAAVIDPILRITSDPSGARVTVNGVGWGTTPVVIRHLPFGAKRIRLTKDGFKADERVVSTASGVTSIQMKLLRLPAEANTSAGAREQ